MEEITIKFTKEEIEHIIKCMHLTWNNRGLCNISIEALIKLEMSISITETRDYIAELKD